MKVAVLCEESGRVRDAFLKLGHDAISCDLLPTSSPGPHIQGDARKYDWTDYDLIIAHPPCTYLTVAANRWLYHPDDKHLLTSDRRPHPNYPYRYRDKIIAIEFVKWLWSIPVKRMCIENPVGVLSTEFKKPTQYIQPYWFGEPTSKKTGLWLRRLPQLKPTNIVEPNIIKRNGYTCPDWMNSTGGGCSVVRSKTFICVAATMAAQWGNLK